MPSQFKYGIIGAGLMGNEHIANIALLPDSAVAGVADPYAPSLDWARKTLGREASDAVQFDTDYRRLLERQDIDAWVIASPNHTHADVLRDVFSTDAAVLIEKPLCTTAEDCRWVVEAARARRAPVWVGLEYRHMPPVAEFIRRLKAGAVGDLKMLAIREHRFPFLKKVGDWNRFNRNTGGTLVEKCCHFFDLMRHIVGAEPVRVMASGAQSVNHLTERYGGERPDIIDNAYVIVEFEGGRRAALDLCMFAEGSENQEEIAAVGDTGKLEVFIPAGEIVTSPRRPKAPVRERIDVDAAVLSAGHHHGATYYQHLLFQACVRDGTPPETGVEDGLASVLMGLAAQKSIAEGRVVAMNEFDT